MGWSMVVMPSPTFPAVELGVLMNSEVAFGEAASVQSGVQDRGSPASGVG